MLNIQKPPAIIETIQAEKTLYGKAVKTSRHIEAHWLTPIMHMLGIFPLLFMVIMLALEVAGIAPIGDLDDFAEEIGTWAMWFFAAMLACTPIHIATGWRRPLKWKKPLALYAFAYTAVHMAGFVFAYNMTTHTFIPEILTSVTMLSGTVALVWMVPLAITSNKWSMKRLGKRWKQLHKATYPIAVITALHLLVVGDALGIVLLLLLAMRLPKVRKTIITKRKEVEKQVKPLLPAVS